MSSLIPWEHTRVFLRKAAVDRLADLRGDIRRVVEANIPTAADLEEDGKRDRRRDRLRTRCEIHVLSLLVARILVEANTAEKAGEVYARALEQLPRNPKLPGSYVTFYTGRAEWREFQFQFSHIRRTRSRSAAQEPEYTVLGFAIASLSYEAVHQTVREGCSTLPNLKEAARCLAPVPS